MDVKKEKEVICWWALNNITDPESTDVTVHDLIKCDP